MRAPEQCAEAAGDQKEIYPNRLHTLLSEEPLRSLNEASVAVIERAVTALNQSQPQLAAAGEEKLRGLFEKVLAAWPNSATATNRLADVARAVQLPPAIAAAALRRLALVPRLGLEPEVRVLAGPLDQQPEAGLELAGRGLSALRRCAPQRDRTEGRPRRPDWWREDSDCLARGAADAGTVSDRSGDLDHPPEEPPAQARRQLQRILTEAPQTLPRNAGELIDRVEFLMVSRLEEVLNDPARAPILVIVDEAHHAAADSYQPLHEASPAVRGLFLTATPNRTDDLPIGIDEIAFTITYRELAERGVILMPVFRPFAVPDFDWSPDSLRDLADNLLENAEGDYVKTLVVCPTILKVNALYQALVDRLNEQIGHILTADDVAFVHSEGASHGDSTEDCLTYFADQPRGILVSAQMLLEGHDDPTINAVVVTYRTESIIKLMQAAGRCVRYSPGKTAAFVVYAADKDLQYRFDQRWLYQEIDDRLLPELVDVEYANEANLLVLLEELLTRHNVPLAIRQRVLTEAAGQTPGDHFRVLLVGLPYFGSVEEFATRATWSAVSETSSNSAEFRQLFNEFCRLGASLSAPRDFLLHNGRPFGLREESAPDSRWRLYHDMLAAMYYAQGEIYADGSRSAVGQHRPYRPDGATTWLKYVTFTHRPSLPPELEAFLTDCFNRDEIKAQWPMLRSAGPLLVKLPLPLAPVKR